MFPIEATDPNNAECFRITSIQGLFASPFFFFNELKAYSILSISVKWYLLAKEANWEL